MLEKLALLKIAFCRAPAFSSTSSACLRELTSPAPSETPIRVLVTSFPLAMVLPYGGFGPYRHAMGTSMKRFHFLWQWPDFLFQNRCRPPSEQFYTDRWRQWAQTPQLRATRRREGSMSKADQFPEYADEAMCGALQSKTEK